MRRVAPTFLLAAALLAQTADQAFEHARRLHQAGRWSEAELAYRGYVKQYGATAEALANLGAVLARQEKFEQAIAKYRQALKLAPGLAAVRLNLGLAYLKSGNRGAAAAEFTAFLEKEPTNRQARQLRAMALLDLERFEEAARDYAALMPTDDLSVRLGLATAYTRMERGAEAREVLAPVLEGSDSAEAQLVLGQALAADGRLDEAKSAFERAARLNSKLATLHFHLGAVYWRRQDTDAAVAEWRKELEAAPGSFQANYTLGAALALSGAGAAEAEALLRKAVRLKPSSAPALYQLAKLVWQRKKGEEAVSLLERSVQADGKYREAHYLLATVYQSLGRKPEAAREFALVKKLSEEEVSRTQDLFEQAR